MSKTLLAYKCLCKYLQIAYSKYTKTPTVIRKLDKFLSLSLSLFYYFTRLMKLLR